MLNNYNSIKNTMQISAVSGSLQKSHTKSYFKSFHIKSNFADGIFHNGSSEIVLQIMNSHDGWVIAEIIKRSDFEAGDTHE